MARDKHDFEDPCIRLSLCSVTTVLRSRPASLARVSPQSHACKCFMIGHTITSSSKPTHRNNPRQLIFGDLLPCLLALPCLQLPNSLLCACLPIHNPQTRRRPNVLPQHVTPPHTHYESHIMNHSQFHNIPHTQTQAACLPSCEVRGPSWGVACTSAQRVRSSRFLTTTRSPLLSSSLLSYRYV